MGKFLFAVAFLLVGLYVLFHGTLMLFWPEKHAQFENWLAGFDRWKANPWQADGPLVEKRLAGLIAIGVAVLMLWLPVRWFLR